jgi:two-component system, OmpR family, response regulator
VGRNDVGNSTGAGARVIVAGDDRTLVQAVAASLRYEGFQVAEAATGHDLVATGLSFDPDLVILDWMLPDIAGTEAVRRLRERGSESPAIYLTSGGAVDFAAVRAGDELLTRPFSLAEMSERVQMTLRQAAEVDPREPLRFADLVLDEERHEVVRSDQRIELTPTEFNLLRLFLLHPRQVLSKRQILQHVWRHDCDNTNVVETYVSYLRRKLNRFGPPLIRTVRRVGYVLDDESRPSTR